MRPRIRRDRRFTWAYLFGAICPARGTGAALVMPTVSIEAMNKHLAEISQCVSVSAIALLILDGAGWHSSPQLIVPDNIVLLPLPPYAPELNSTENIWEYLRGNWLSHCVWDTYEAYVDGLMASTIFCVERFGRLRSYVRPFDAEHVSAGPDEVRRPGTLSIHRAFRSCFGGGLFLVFGGDPCRSSRLVALAKLESANCDYSLLR
jgi:hypothetical protein